MRNVSVDMPISAEKTKRFFWLDMLRAFSILLVVVIHVSAQNFYKTPVSSTRWVSFAFYDCFAHIAVPLFVMISGALFLNKDRKIDVKKLYSKNILRICTAFIFWSLINIADIILNTYIDQGNLTGIDTKKIIGTFITGSSVMWFIFMIVGLYIITPLLRRITSNGNYTLYFIVLWFIMGSVIPAVFELCKLREWDYVSYFSSAYSKMHFTFALEFSGYYVLGHYLFKNDFSKSKRMLIYGLGFLGAVFCVLITVIVSQSRDKAYVYFINSYIAPNLVLAASGAFVFFKYELSVINLPSFCRKFINSVSACSFGIYLIHMFILNWLERAGFTSRSFVGWLCVPALTGVVFLISYIIVLIISKIPFFNKYII
ncbi:MAG: acyltransferase family protein [Eubacterium sp.]|nr:acyltransferase family protein [Eubacterium sp.]